MTQPWFYIETPKNAFAVTQQSEQLRPVCFLLCSTNHSSYSWHAFAQVNKHIPDIFLSGNTTATSGNKFRYCWKAKLATTSLSLFSFQQHSGQVADFLWGGFMCLWFFLPSQNGEFFSLKHWLLLFRFPMYPLHSPFLIPSHFSSLKTSQTWTVSCKKLQALLGLYYFPVNLWLCKNYFSLISISLCCQLENWTRQKAHTCLLLPPSTLVTLLKFSCPQCFLILKASYKRPCPNAC